MLKGMGVNGLPNTQRRSCFDCNHCQSANSWWCVSEKAFSERNTRIPGVIDCPYWEPISTKEELKSKAGFFSKVFGSYMKGYIEVDLSNNEESNYTYTNENIKNYTGR